MGAHTGRNENGSGSDQYWRRRAVALASVLAATGLLAWACTGASGDDSPAPNAGAAGASSPPAAPTAMPTVTVTATTTPRATAAAGGACRDRDLVFSIATSRTTYAGTATPEFRITVVNMGGGSCTLDTGSLDVRVTSGADRLWSSAECRRGGASKKTVKRGVPYVDTVVWDRKRGCAGGAIARPGTYVAALKDEKAKKKVFYLR
ncbi:hypothetical protein ACFOY4_40435 [Actinomadura syzygii]|uniref:DUF4232 domain-containing protein n=1 Tax=Actinomadura syzygii TaxID=1427538 RepID=A0A5D0U7S6_9ACTN|nr:hypothetical protein [Actinomadura syzygii]TYC14621.1 hypothetical protein FXF65_17425 [Actinomadura syzygii]